MKKEFVPYELALKMKQLGFNEPCLCSWNFYTNELNFNGQPSTFSSEDVIQLPTFQQAFRWFREKNDLYYTIEGSKKYGFAFFIYYENDDKGELKSKEYFTYEESELACLEKLIEIVENNK